MSKQTFIRLDTSHFLSCVYWKKLDEERLKNWYPAEGCKKVNWPFEKPFFAPAISWIHFALFLVLKIETNLKKPKGICKMADQSLLTQIHPPRVSCCDRFMAKTRKRTTSKYDFGWPLLLLRSISCTTAEQKRLSRGTHKHLNIWPSDQTPCHPLLHDPLQPSIEKNRETLFESVQSKKREKLLTWSDWSSF